MFFINNLCNFIILIQIPYQKKVYKQDLNYKGAGIKAKIKKYSQNKNVLIRAAYSIFFGLVMFGGFR